MNGWESAGGTNWSGPLMLASRSERRRSLLAEAGIESLARASDLDDGDLHPPKDVDPRAWVMALAYFKARRVATLLDGDPPSDEPGVVVLAADTVCAHRGRILGQPVDARHAQHMLESMQDDEHVTLSGVCLIQWSRDGAWRPESGRVLFSDATRVHIGPIDAATIERYVDGDGWRGKAGGYNLSERLDDGWPIDVEGDPTTVMGLPMMRLRPILIDVIRTAARPEPNWS